ncbi:bacteriocin immunity protein [Latilactobacillus sakei]|nr:bacteriocin immunity protein [Latilactobacillus sakei]SPS04290.1 hypothetical protein LAS9624_01130 [Latilactobacillus sakei]
MNDLQKELRQLLLDYLKELLEQKNTSFEMAYTIAKLVQYLKI